MNKKGNFTPKKGWLIGKEVAEGTGGLVVPKTKKNIPTTVKITATPLDSLNKEYETGDILIIKPFAAIELPGKEELFAFSQEDIIAKWSISTRSDDV